MNQTTVRVALVGCGQIADAHLQEIRKIPSADPVAVCDRHLVLAQQLAARFEVPHTFDNLEEMLETVRPDVLHVTTPPQLHAPMACQALQRQVHVYVEKPFALDLEEADRVLQLAQAQRRLVCAGHDHLFEPIWLECRRAHAQGETGQIIHIDSIQQYDLAGPFGKAVTTDPEHWVHRLPGQLFQNVVPHAVYKIADFLTDEQPELWATAFCGPDAANIPSELRVVLRGQQTTAHLLFSCAARPVQKLVRLYGTREQLEVDGDAWVLRRYRATRMPGAFSKLELPARDLRQAAGNLARNLWRMCRSRLQYFAGMRRLFELFYRAIGQGSTPPIPYEDIRRVTALLDRIFRLCLPAGAAGAGSPSATLVAAPIANCRE